MRQRICHRAGCHTPLSTYNPGEFCWTHTLDLTQTDRPAAHMRYRDRLPREHVMSRRFVEGFQDAYPFPEGGDAEQTNP